jgi:geranylgeranyl diphosphate synthase type II
VTEFDLTEYLTKRRAAVEAALPVFLPDTGGRLARAMHYTVMSGGKRLRPILCIAAAEAVSPPSDSIPPQVMRAACALEMIHAYSLIHDDLPAMDDDDLRRGKPSCHIAFDEATAVLAGDALLTLAFEILTGGIEEQPNAAKNRLLIIRNIATAAGWAGMVEGQTRDMAAEGTRLSPDELAKLHNKKTGAMIVAAVETGAMLAGGTATQQDALRRYAENIGLAFQVTDDVLNVTGNPNRLGKATGTDAAKGKNTYPALLGLDESNAFAASLIQEAKEALEPFGKAAAALCAIADYIGHRTR